MKKFIATAFLASILTADLIAQVDFWFLVHDETRTATLHHGFVQSVQVYDWNSEDHPRLVYSTKYHIYGVNQDRVTFTTEFYAGSIPRTTYDAFLKRARRLPSGSLNQKSDVTNRRTSGSIDLDDDLYKVCALPETEARRAWQALLNDFLKECAPVRKRKRITRTVEGEIVQPKEVDFHTLLANPKSFDGKRIRITGFYHDEFESSSLAATKADLRSSDGAEIWLGSESTFSQSGRVANVNNAFITVEGTFMCGPAGHMGLWKGELVRVTRLERIKKKQRHRP